MSHNLDIQLDKTLPKETDLAIKLIAALTGEDPAKFHGMSADEIFQHLAFLMKCRKEKILELLREHDQNEALDLNELSRLWKLSAKNVVRGRKSTMGSTPTAFVEKILFLMAQRMDVVRILTENGLGSAALTSEAMTNQKFSISLKDKHIISSPSFAAKAISGSNDNSNSGRSF